MLVGTGSDGQLRVWRSDLGKEITALDVRQQTLTEDNPSNAIVSKSSRREDTQDVSVKSVAFCKNQTLFAVLLADGNISVAWYKLCKRNFPCFSNVHFLCFDLTFFKSQQTGFCNQLL